MRGAAFGTILLFSMLAPIAHADDSVRIVYAHGEGNTAVDAYDVPEWPVGQRLCRIADRHWMVVKEVGKKEKRGERVDRFYDMADEKGPVGKVFGAQLTPYCFEQDLDGDGAMDPVVAYFTDDFQIRVQGANGTVDLRPHGEGYLSLKGGNAAVKLLGKEVAGVPLILVTSRPDACADYGDYYVLVTGGKPQLALSTDGLADPPTSVTQTVRFDPVKKEAIVTTVIDNDEGKHPKTKRERYRLTGSTYVAVKKSR